MALTSAQFVRSGKAEGVSDADGRKFGINTGGISDSISNSGSVAAPGAVGQIVALTAGDLGGVYRINGVLILTGTAETALTNIRLRQAGIGLTTLPSISGLVVPFTVDRVTLSGNRVIDLIAIAAATAGSIYTCELSATRVE